VRASPWADLTPNNDPYGLADLDDYRGLAAVANQAPVQLSVKLPDSYQVHAFSADAVRPIRLAVREWRRADETEAVWYSHLGRVGHEVPQAFELRMHGLIVPTARDGRFYKIQIKPPEETARP